MTVFLRWALIQSLFAVGLVSAFLLYDGELPTVAVLAVVAVLCIYALASAPAGRYAWSGRGNLRHVGLGIRLCPMVAMLGTISGFLVAFSGGPDDVQARVLGASTGLVSTFVGVAATVVLMIQEHLLENHAA